MWNATQNTPHSPPHLPLGEYPPGLKCQSPFSCKQSEMNFLSRGFEFNMFKYGPIDTLGTAPSGSDVCQLATGRTRSLAGNKDTRERNPGTWRRQFCGTAWHIDTICKKKRQNISKGDHGGGGLRRTPPPGMTQILAVKGTASRQLYLTFKMLTWKYLLFHKRLAPQAVGTQRKLRFGQLTLTRGGRHLKTGETGCTTRPGEPFPGFVECRVLSSPLMI